MEKFTTLTGLVVPLDRSNVDTDAIIPKQFLKSIYRTGYGPNCFDEWRYLDKGEPGMDNSKRPVNPDFVLNFPRYKGAEILLARKNFGCGSSREHAPWALLQYGFRCVIAPSFADIFYSNSLKNGLVPVVLSEDVIDRLFRDCEKTEGYRLTVDLDKQTVTEPDGTVTPFEISAFRRWAIMNGFDDIGITLSTRQDKIRAFEDKRLAEKPWLAKMLNQ
ncbi:3-isopropylmalate dehydratase small subunit [Duodenibacillus massiliensis]|jgi:3-isopropylmalate dehydratase small subunit|uniref:3-isopropylmalate dehydratase small subunit n=1 Tax=Duodenibacillus massiliensis TaxID=1852381 RepID=UPI000334B36E|nr:3-isopropylmalate dehydratase small subunit [Duodenibacillus massiliensis]MBE5702002.1 3-isopropylmalate dehydratase small subunit [Sutterella sp.]MBS5792100.1 3-isopropylmalate dehydratase small subunit [Sutterella sp.]CDD70583.1 3-isopropylmalate dehydratase small subunit [Sutterella sp. CAG:397]HAF64896.1 3-isopropylmalate dehydratase small subunit [Sutterella sp.]